MGDGRNGETAKRRNGETAQAVVVILRRAERKRSRRKDRSLGEAVHCGYGLDHDSESDPFEPGGAQDDSRGDVVMSLWGDFIPR